MRLTFWGAARQVTGSMYLLQTEDELNILIDCGLDLQKTQENSHIIQQGYHSIFPFEASQIHAVLLTHAHIDHSGYIPNLIREGFEGTIFCTKPTRELTKILLEDSASINQPKLKKLLNIRNHKRKTAKEIEILEKYRDLYSFAHVEQSMPLFRTIDFKQRIQLTKNFSFYFNPTGHLLGAANIIIEVKENGKKKKICFSGDIGRKNYPLLQDPEPVEQVDYLICESTYGNRKHKNKENVEEMLLNIIQTTCVDKPGRLIIPSFSIGRTQSLLYVMNKLCKQNAFPPVKVFSDSPLALQSTRIYEKYLSYMNEEAKQFYYEHQNLFDFKYLMYVEDLKHSQMIANYHEPCVIISSSGMLQGGRIEHHIKQNLQNIYATILMVGFAAEGTLGYDLLHNNGQLHIKNTQKTIPILARIESIDVFSGHGDMEDLLNFVKYQDSERLQKIFLVHGELQSMYDFKETLRQQGYPQVEIPSKGQSFEL
ncbi:MAG: MBL fold metallo-hydrolase [Microscillaceae bacterium]|nr:MBL fold metallo-hydrolase [Microscillaceae bacterium]MDW8460982.1 MBL fold metallo-hydrolase [Cytophagales bacterium]